MSKKIKRINTFLKAYVEYYKGKKSLMILLDPYKKESLYYVGVFFLRME